MTHEQNIEILSYSRDRLLMELEAAMHALNQIPDEETDSPVCVALVERVHALEAAQEIQDTTRENSFSQAETDGVPTAILTHPDGTAEQAKWRSHSRDLPFTDPRALII
ncbi:MAG: hypothetical protein H8F28_18320 [Fibrella sp.]|nr:hypothetical protein [Armatimonadota bacterium]